MSKAQPTITDNVVKSFDTKYQGASYSGVVTAAQYLYAAENGTKINNKPGAVNQSLWGQPSSEEPLNNLPFDHRIARIGANGIQGSGAFTQGVKIASGKMSAVGIDNRTYTTYFEFNPTEIDLSYGFDSSVSAVLNPSFLAQSDQSVAQSSQGLMLNQSVSFTLLFDRTYEVWTGKQITKTARARRARSAISAAGGHHLQERGPNNQQDLGGAQRAIISQLANSYGPFKFGVMWDVWAIERLAGIFGQYNGAPPSGPPAANITKVEFGPDSTGKTLGLSTVLGGGYAFGFTGWMTALEVQYTRFDASMVPTRCAVGLTFEQIYSLQAASTNPEYVSGASS